MSARCEACPAAGDTPAAFVATYADPEPISFNVCPKHAAAGLAGGANIAPLTPEED